MLTRAAIGLLGSAIAACGLDTVDRVAAAGGVLAFYLGIRRRVVQHNVRVVFPRRSGTWRRRVGYRSYASMGANFLGLLHLGAHGPRVLDQVSVAAPSHLARHAQRFPGSVWLTAHLGSWDLGAAMLAQVHGQCNVYATPQHHAVADEIINTLRERLGFRVILSAHGDRRGAVHALRGLRNGVPLGLLADQGPRPARGVGAWFLGQAVSCHQGPAFFAKQCAVPIISGVTVRVRAGRYRLYHGAPILPTAGDEEYLRQAGLDQLSALIAALPGQYFWHHRRFKYPMPAPARPTDPWREHGVSILGTRSTRS